MDFAVILPLIAFSFNGAVCVRARVVCVCVCVTAFAAPVWSRACAGWRIHTCVSASPPSLSAPITAESSPTPVHNS